MTEHIETFFKTTVFAGITIGLISLGLGLYYELFGKKRVKRYSVFAHRKEAFRNDNNSSMRA